MTDIAPAPSKDNALKLMAASMPPFEAFLAHVTTLKAECEKAGELTDERTALFDQYTAALSAAQDEYNDAIATFICDEFTAEEVDHLIAFYASPTRKAVEKAIGLGAVVSNIGTAWTTKVLERCPDTWKMLVNNIGEWQRKNTPPDSEVVLPNAPPGAPGAWKKVDLSGGPQAAEEYVPSAPAEEAELERLRSV